MHGNFGKNLTVIISSLGDATELVKTLDSINNEVLEVIVVTIDSKKEKISNYLNLQQFSFPIKIKSTNLRGIYQALNCGVEHAAGKFVYFLQNDEFLNPNWNSSIRRAADIYLFHFRNVSNEIVYSSKNTYSLMRKGRMPTSHQGQIWRTSTIRDLGYFTTHIDLFNGKMNIPLKICSDFDLLTRAIIENKDIEFVDEELARTSNYGVSDIRVHRRFIETSIILYKNGVRNLASTLLFLARLEINHLVRCVTWSRRSEK